MRKQIAVVLCSAAICGAAPAAAQSIAQRVPSAPSNATIRFSYDVLPGVCGDGEKIVSRRGDDDDITVMRVGENGKSFNTTSRNSREDWLRNCEPGPARFVVQKRAGTITSTAVSVGGSPSSVTTDLGTVSAADAVRYLLDLAATGQDRAAKHALFAATIANAQQQVTDGLITLVRNDDVRSDTRKEAVFWLGQTREPRAISTIKSLLNDESESVELRKSAIFAIAQQHNDDAVTTLLSIARNAKSGELRNDAVFWLGQAAGDRATQGLKSIVGDDSDEMETRQEAVFALSQQKNEQSIPVLIEIARNNKEPKLRKSALFWLGQKHDDPRVLKLFEEILLKK